MFKRAKKGFTLIELLVVIFIIGLLASVVVVNVNAARIKARDAKRKSDIASVQTAIETFADENGEYPVTTTLGDFCQFEAGPTANPTWGKSYRCPNSWIPGVTPQFISTLPRDPRSATTYNEFFSYWYRSDGTNYKIFARQMEGPEGKKWAEQDGGTRNDCAAPSTCAYEIFSGGAQTW